ncbi:PhzF family phenazine biosynthesis isomerase [Nibribacter ruber]|uniref:PhzF family phenazine biosynthesis isomerase n=1 Tax=Nibribacter ruber TaxID=2698458 RepID=A0A6P1NSH8_9BACT|nr:PhzF family phenazine biosynthesis protein [Nibribacter ruber]QHL86796.1 PhzF family phenazine biosynthesis isomerase [Nibribacter ruber]
MQTLPFYIVDVFADQPYRGNQLAVFLQAGNLRTEQMQQIAQEIGFAESAFVLQDTATPAGYPARYFTVEYEVPFAGHPTLGTAFVLQQVLEKTSVPEVKLHLPVGTIPVSFSYDQQGQPDFLMMQQINPVLEEPLPADDLPLVLGLPGEALHPEFPVQVVSTGLPFLLIPLQRLEDMRQIHIKEEVLLAFLQKHHLFKTQREDGLSVALYLFCPETYQKDRQINARMLAYENGKVIEDAATGSANGCLLGYLLQHEYLGPGAVDILVEQGCEINRHATIRLQGQQHPNHQFDIRVGGQVQLISKGEWYVH